MLNEHDFPPFLPAGRYRLELNLKYGGYSAANASAYFEIIYKVKY